MNVVGTSTRGAAERPRRAEVISEMSDLLLRAQVRVQTTLSSLRQRQEGQGLVEYGLIIASIAILLIVAMLFMAGKIDNLFSNTGTSVETPGPLPQ
jgi:pilus assembly protein Flp/PilA